MQDKIARNPVLQWGAVTGLVMATLTLLVSLGVIDLSGEQMSAVEAFTVALGVLIVPIVLSIWPRARVTPNVDPRDVDGEPLWRMDGGEPLGVKAKK